MKRAWIRMIAGLFLFAGTSWAWAQTGHGSEAEVAALEQQWLQSQKTSNPDLLAPLLAEKFVNISTDGTVSDKAQTLALVKAAKFSSAEYVGVTVTVFRETAIARGDFRGQGTDSSGKTVEVSERWTDTWVKMANGKWQCVVSHASQIKSLQKP